MTLLHAATASRLSEAEFDARKEIAATMAADNMSFRATLARGATLDRRSWGIANKARNKLRHMWRDFFERFDVLLAPDLRLMSASNDRQGMASKLAATGQETSVVESGYLGSM